MKKGYFVAVMLMVSVFILAIGLTQAQAQPDLKVISLNVQDYTAPGVGIFIGDVTRNIGDTTAPETITTYYLSKDKKISKLDIKLGRRYVPALDPGVANSGTRYVMIPETVAPGQWYIIANADGGMYVTESKEGNNKKVKPITVLGVASANLPDLVVSSLTAPGSAAPGDKITITDKTENLGPGNAFITKTAFYLSTDTTLDSGDVAIGSRYVPALDAGAYSQKNTSVVIPDVADGTYYIIANADDFGVLAEVDETNNTNTTAISISGP
jgi:subtilase family serine protease